MKKPLSFLPFVGMALLSSSEAVDYQEEIRPILNKKCFKCHTGPRAKGGLRMDSPADFSRRIGGEKPAVIPGDPGKSLLSVKAGLPATDGDAMPPPPARERGAEGLTAVELALVRQWIAEGAKFEEGEAAPSAPETTSSTGEMKPEFHTWTNSGGGALKAAFVSFDGTNVVLRKEDGEEFPYALANLSAESQALVKKLAGDL